MRAVLRAVRDNPLPVSVGVALMGALQYRHVREREKRHVARYGDDPEALIVGDFHVAALKSIPFRHLSRLWGKVNAEYALPMWLRRPVYSWWKWAYGCDLSEMAAGDLTEYRNLNEFFTRRLAPGCRPISTEHLVVSPADARILHFGPVEEKSIEQVKGVTYSLDAFLGCGDHSLQPELEHYQHIPYNSRDNQLYHCVLYLAPGDYHRFHSPADWAIEKVKHFSGQLFSVSPGMVRIVRGLFVLNERINMLGAWRHGFFSMTAVGATNVGSIELAFDKSLKTNRRIRAEDGAYLEKSFVLDKETPSQADEPAAAVIDEEVVMVSENDPKSNARLLPTTVETALKSPLKPGPLTQFSGGLRFQKGDELGQFNLGSTVVLIFEAPRDNFRFFVHADQKIKYGEPLAGMVSPATRDCATLQSHPPLHTIQEVVDYIGERDEIV